MPDPADIDEPEVEPLEDFYSDQSDGGTVQIHGGGVLGIPSRARPEELESAGSRVYTAPMMTIQAGETSAPTEPQRRSILEQLSTREGRRALPAQIYGQEDIAVQPIGWQRPQDRYQAPRTFGERAEQFGTDLMTRGPIWQAATAVQDVGRNALERYRGQPLTESAREASPEARRAAFGGGLSQALTFNHADELTAALGEMVGYDEGMSPEERITNARNQMEATARAAPEADITGTVAGVATTMAIPGTGALGVESQLGRAALAGGEAVGYGALAGEGASEAQGLGNRLSEAAPMAGAGGAASAGLSLLGPQIGRGLSALGRAAERRATQSALNKIIGGRGGDRVARASERALQNPEVIRTLPSTTIEGVRLARDASGSRLGSILAATEREASSAIAAGATSGQGVVPGRVDADQLGNAIQSLADEADRLTSPGAIAAPEVRDLANRARRLQTDAGAPVTQVGDLRRFARENLPMDNRLVIDAYKLTSSALERAIAEADPAFGAMYRIENARYGPLAQLHSVASPTAAQVLGRGRGGLTETAERAAGAMVGGAAGAVVAPAAIGAIRSVASTVHRGAMRGVARLLRSSPERLGQAAEPLRTAIQRGGMQAFSAEYHRQMQSDSQFRALAGQIEAQAADSPERDNEGFPDEDAMMEEDF